VISQEKHHTYGRPLISYLLQGKTTRENIAYRAQDFYTKNNCTFIAGKTAEKIDPKAKEVFLDDGTHIAYDRLLVATGSSPFTPPMEGLDSVAHFSFMTLDDALELEKALESKPRVLIVGAGLIGMKCAEGIASRAQSVTVVELADRVLPTVLDEKGSSVIQKEMEAHGVSFVLGDRVKRFTPKNPSGGKSPGGTALTEGGTSIEFDVLVTAVGVRPNTALVGDAGGTVHKGIAVDDHLRTSIPDVYAAGDCTESRDITTDEDKILALLPNAYFQGETAGFNMAGRERAFINAIPMNAAGFFDVHLVTAGSYLGEGIEIAYNEAKNEGAQKPAPHGEMLYKKFFVRDDLLKGYIIIGDTSRAGIYTSLIREKTPLSSIDFEAIKTAPALMPFGRKTRAEILGGAL
jgi:NAD(P)H-nitrite reductase large subunit